KAEPEPKPNKRPTFQKTQFGVTSNNLWITSRPEMQKATPLKPEQ
ncbi:hypothetical protein GWI33_010335, partial [Rhynchophorus ferrugineus]